VNKSRPKQVMFRLSEEEAKDLQKKIEKSGISQQDDILKSVFDKPITNTDGIKELIPELKRQEQGEAQCKIRNNKLEKYYNMDLGKEE